MTTISLPESTIKQLHDFFLLIDEDADGLIGHADLQRMFKSINYDIPVEEVRQMIKDAGPDPTANTINFNTLLSVMDERLNQFSGKDDLNSALLYFHGDSEKEIDAVTFSEYLASINQNDPESQKAIKMVFSEFSKAKEITGEVIFNYTKFVNQVGQDE
ncbi:hypothetical protein BABINDRAFT_161611 [Babjeviella inositovora NRRL Y-12698]|uniref:EF-hand domain-containing protein n=1 Tax=Babjeviella inositovora NRRL Y-12698 TaxID=984486 RepID=A0A1E3QSP6_9ASCO|nr:uncharacterized protein BABINDRAFT_161611 [Babjeviella inositovora NRRL Y-12698]ODQ79947.1 hypothetical protein BABINDRAFT_161611 [Babjeviella inositovora NRRL Y-12698]